MRNETSHRGGGGAMRQAELGAAGAAEGLSNEIGEDFRFFVSPAVLIVPDFGP
jgi:hypothetical protein